MMPQREQGNIDLKHRPVVKNRDGTISTVRSMDVYDSPEGPILGQPQQGPRILLPTVSNDGRLLSDQEAIDYYKQTKQHLGKFDTPEEASAYAERLHREQDLMYGLGGVDDE